MEIRRKIFLLLGHSFLIITLLFPQIANASSLSSKREEVRRTKNQVDALSRDLYEITNQYSTAVSKLDKIRTDLSRNESELAVAQKELEKDQKILNGRVKNIYCCGAIQFLEVVLGSKNLQEFLVRSEMLNKIGQRDTTLLNQIKAKRQQIEEKKEQLASQKAQQHQVVAELKNKQSQMEANLQKQKQLLSGVEGEFAKLEQEERDARARAEQERQRRQLASRSGSTSKSVSSVKVSTSGFVFPCAGPHSYANDWGAPRAGHRHQGCDIMAARGTPAVACVSGTVRTSEGGRQGRAIWLHGDDGNSYFYAHLSGYAVTSGHVNAGQVIGYVGNTGNASGGACHIHFEIHPGGGGAINPYPTLRAAD